MKNKTYYSLTLSHYVPGMNAYEEYPMAVIHKRDNLTDQGLLRILAKERPDKVDKGTSIVRVERMVYLGHN